jgi:DNA-binding Xre family transcriptional regulator
MTVELDTGWNLRRVMASRGIFQTSKLKPLLVTQPPQRVRLDVLAALCDALECSLDDLVTIARREASTPVAVGEEATRGSIGDLRPVRATIRRPRTK